MNKHHVVNRERKHTGTCLCICPCHINIHRLWRSPYKYNKGLLSEAFSLLVILGNHLSLLHRYTYPYIYLPKMTCWQGSELTKNNRNSIVLKSYRHRSGQRKHMKCNPNRIQTLYTIHSDNIGHKHNIWWRIYWITNNILRVQRCFVQCLKPWQAVGMYRLLCTTQKKILDGATLQSEDRKYNRMLPIFQIVNMRLLNFFFFSFFKM